MVNDDAGDRVGFQAQLRPGLVYVVARDDHGQVLALFVLAQSYPSEAEVHFCFRPAVWGSTEDVARAFVDWIWRETPIDRLIGPVPGYNQLALQLARKVGFEPLEVVKAHVPRRGRRYDLNILGLNRPTGFSHAQISHPRNVPHRS